MTRRLWRVFLPLGLALMLSLSGDLTLYAVLPVYAPTLGLSLGMVGLLLSANRLIRLASNPLVGFLLDRRGRRGPFLAGMALGTLSTLSYAVAPHFAVLLLGRLMWGTAWSLIYVGAYSMVVDVTKVSDRGWGSGVLQGFYHVGLAVNPLLGGLLVDRLGFQPALGLCAIPPALGFALAALALPETRRVPTAGEARPLARAALRSQLKALRGQRGLLSGSYLFLLSLLAGDGIVMSTTSLYLQQTYGVALSWGGLVLRMASLGGLLIGLRALLTAVLAPLIGRFSDRSANRWTACAAGTLSGVAGMALLALGLGLGWFGLGIALVAASGAVLSTVLPALVGDMAEERQRGATLSVLITVGDIGSAVAPLAAYTLVTALPLSGVYLLTALLLATGLAVPWRALAAQPPRPKSSVRPAAPTEVD